MRYMKLKKYSLITLIIFVVVFSYIYIANAIESSNEPYHVINELIEDAKEYKSFSELIINQDEFNLIKNEFFKKLGYELDWNKFKEFINNSGYSWYEITKPDLVEKIFNSHGRNQLNISVQFYYRTSRGAPSDTITLSVEKIEGKWKVVGVLRASTTVEVYK